MLGAPPCATSRFFYAAGCFSLCCTGLALILLGFGARSNPYPRPLGISESRLYHSGGEKYRNAMRG